MYCASVQAYNLGRKQSETFMVNYHGKEILYGLLLSV